MSTISIAPQAPHAQAPHISSPHVAVSESGPRVALAHGLEEGPRATRLTRRGRMVMLFGFLSVITVLLVALGPMAGASLTSGTPEPVRIVQVGPGDTLFGIAGQVADPGKVREMVVHIERLNSLDGPELQ